MTNPDFASLLKKPAGEAKRPPLLPAGSAYEGIIKSHEFQTNQKTGNSFVRFQIGLTSWDPSVPDEWTVVDNNTGETWIAKRADVDISRRSMRRDFFFTDDAMYRLDNFLRSCGITLGRGYDECIPETTGKAVLCKVEQQLNQNTSEMFNQLGDVVGKG